MPRLHEAHTILAKSTFPRVQLGAPCSFWGSIALLKVLPGHQMDMWSMQRYCCVHIWRIFWKQEGVDDHIVVALRRHVGTDGMMPSPDPEAPAPRSRGLYARASAIWSRKKVTNTRNATFEQPTISADKNKKNDDENGTRTRATFVTSKILQLLLEVPEAGALTARPSHLM